MLRQRGLDNPLVSLDPCHCLDLGSKDMAGTNIVKSILMESAEVYHFCIRSRMDGIHRESIAFNELEDSGTVKNVVETRMNLIHIHLTDARKQSAFMASLSTNPKYIKYYKDRTSKQKAEIDVILDNFGPSRWRRMEAVYAVTVHFEQAHKLCSREDDPLSCYVLIVQALYNGVKKAITYENCKFDRVLGEGAAQQIEDVLMVRFKMNGQSPPGQGWHAGRSSPVVPFDGPLQWRLASEV